MYHSGRKRTALCLVVLLMLGTSTTFAIPSEAPSTTFSQRPGPMFTLQASGIDEHSRVLPVQHRPDAVNTATFVVNYTGVWDPQAQAAFQYAVDQWSSQIYSPVPIEISAAWTNLGATTLGSAGATIIRRNFTNAPVAATWYPIALANALAGLDLSPASTDITANFNSNFANWYFGTDGATPGGTYDFVSVVMHEIGHGLGFAGSATVVTGQGSWGNSGDPYIYDRFTENNAGTATINTGAFANPSAALAAHLQSDALYFDGPNADAANAGVRPRLYAPATWAQGSSYSHLNEATYLAGNPNSLMTPQIGSAESIHSPGPITMGIFKDLGWGTTGSPGQPGPDFVVNVLGDAPSDAGCTAANCTLREATVAANVSADGSTITFGVAGTITLTQGQLTASTPITITSSNTVTISGNNAARIAFVNTGARLGLVGLTLTQGNAGASDGGVVYNAGTLVVQQSTLSGNTAAFGGALLNDGGTMTVHLSTLSGNSATTSGGGIYNNTSGTATLTYSTLSGNTTTNSHGGGIFNNAAMTIQQSTVSGNTTGGGSSLGGGIFNNAALTIQQSTVSGNIGSGHGGGIFNNATLTIQQSTVSGNSVSGSNRGGGIYNNATLTIQQSTVSGNTAGIGGGGGINMNIGTITIGNTIVSGNTATIVADLRKASGTITSQGYNLIGTTSTTADFAALGDQHSVANPMLGALQDNGGSTQTQLPATGSLAINAGPATSPFATDQRGHVRVANGNVDIGAVEANAPTAVALLAFSGEHTSAGITVRWSVAQQDAVLGYRVERQAASDWLTVGEPPVSGLGTYALADPAASTAAQTYRLSAHNADGSYTALGETTVHSITLLYLPLIHD